MYDPITVEMDKDRLYEAAVYEVKRNRRGVPKTFQAGLLQN